MLRPFLFALSLAACTITAANAASGSGPGYTETEIRIGNLAPYSGPASSYSVIAETQAAYFNMINEAGGIGGRKIKFMSLDDAYSPPKAVEQTRRLVESEDVAALFNPIGTPSNAAIQRYLNSKKVPQLFVGTGASRFNDPKGSPWTVGYNATYETEARVYGKYLLANKPDAKIAILVQNDDSGRDQVHGLEVGLGDKAKSMIIAKATYEPSDAVIDSQILKLKASGADVFVSFGTPKAGSQAIRKVAELGWKPLYFLANTQSSVASVLTPAGLDNAKGLISSTSYKDVSDPTWDKDPDVVAFKAFVEKRMPGVSYTNANVTYGYVTAQTMVQVLKQCGADVSRENIIKQALSLKGFAPALILPGITLNTSPEDHEPMQQLQLIRFDGERWSPLGPVLSE